MGWFEDLSASQQSQTSGIRVAPETALEQYANPMLQRGLQGLEGLVGAGPGEAQIKAGTGGVEDYAKMLQGFMTPQGLFGMQQQGIDQYTKLGEQIFGGQMRQQQQEAQRLAGRMGRPVNDPILQAKLAQQRADTVGSFAAQQSLALPGQLAQFGGQRAEALQGLASQAMANRQALLGMGSNLREQDRAYRINTGERYSTQQQAGSFMSSLGGIAGIAGTVMGGIGQLSQASNYGRLVDNELAKGAMKGATGGGVADLGKGMTGILGVGGGGQPSGAGGLLGGFGAMLGGGAKLAQTLAPRAPAAMPQQAFASSGGGPGAASMADYNMPVGQNYDVFAPKPTAPSLNDPLRYQIPSNMFNTGPWRSELPTFNRPNWINKDSTIGSLFGG